MVINLRGLWFASPANYFYNKKFMTRYEHLNIYKESYNLSKILFWIVSKFSRDYKYTLWDKILDSIINIISNIVLCNQVLKEERQKYFLAIDENIFKLNLFINLANDLKILGKENNYIWILESLVKIKKMKESWEK